ncbi:MAG: RecQ family ATP-dependent DNA helicase, partial [Clostridiales Family XIII bacterium]|nr:RecQ family ATP-dependent DNA helicase [Clostridiales Family XIII bacterium]
MENSLTILEKYFGYHAFRDGQEPIIENILGGRDALGIMPTGAGKSMCYQVPAMMFDGVTIVVSPLISLMKDQVQALTQAGVPAAFINSSLNMSELDDVYHRARTGDYKILYVAPERLTAPDWLTLAGEIKISMVTVDEAHCISQWGQDFRPSYLAIPDFIESLTLPGAHQGAHQGSRPVVSAFTATATAQVREDIVVRLRLQDPLVMLTGFDRPNLYYEVQKPKNKTSALLKILRERQDRSGIVYCSTRKAVEEVCAELTLKGYAVTRYHAGLSEKERRANQEDFQYDRKTVMVATNAFGMGIDKSNVGYVIHYNMPKNLESYYQEAGRAGRDGSPADCILLYSGQDVRTGQFLIEKSIESNEDLTYEQKHSLMEKDLALLSKMTIYTATQDCLRGYILKYFGEKTDIYCGNCSNCNTTFEEKDVTEEAQKIVSCIVRMSKWNQSYGRAYGKTMIADVLRGSAVARIIQTGFDRLPTYGIMADVPKRRIIDIIDHLIINGYLNITEDKYPVVTLTNRYKEITNGEALLKIKLPKHKEPEKQKTFTGTG